MKSKFYAVVSNNCVACGACMKVCPREAIKVKKGVRAFVDESLCVGCGLCVNICPAGVISKVERGKDE